MVTFVNGNIEWYGAFDFGKMSYRTTLGGLVSDLQRLYTVPGSVVPAETDIKNGPRAGDADRERYVGHINDCMARGFIDEQEREARVHAAQKAAGRHELKALIADLPAAPEAPVARSRQSRFDAWAHQDPPHRIMTGFLGFIAGLLIVAPGQFAGSGTAGVTIAVLTAFLGVGFFVASVFYACHDLN